MIRLTTLENGLRVVTESMHDSQTVSMSYWVGTGSRDESSKEAGISHFLEHLLFKGTSTRTALQIAESIDALGGDMNAFTTKECTSFYVRVLSDDVVPAHAILGDIMCNPAFDPSEVDAERQVVLEEMLMRGDEPTDLVYENYAASAYNNHSLGREILGDESLIESITPAEIRAFFDTHYGAANVVFAAAGNVDHNAMVDLVARTWTKSNVSLRPERVAPGAISRSWTAQEKDTEQTHLVLGVAAPNRHDMRRYTTSVLDTLLGGGMSSRLIQEVREKRGLAYSVYSAYSAYDDAGDFSVYAGTTPARAHETYSVLRAELSRVRNDVTEDELSRAKRHMKATMIMGLEDAGSRMSRVGRSLLMHGDVLSLEEIVRRVHAVTLQELKGLADELFSCEPVVSIVGPNANQLRDEVAT